jgi:hypothetical protein
MILNEAHVCTRKGGSTILPNSQLVQHEATVNLAHSLWRRAQQQATKAKVN